MFARASSASARPPARRVQVVRASATYLSRVRIHTSTPTDCNLVVGVECHKNEEGGWMDGWMNGSDG